jgi:DNA-binding PadR family transcriptional regulator
MDTITNKEAALLNLLSENPKHAYEIEQDIKERDMRFWTEISMSSVYKLLNKLEAQKLLKSTVRLSKKQVAQKIYTLTARGKKAFRDKLLLLLSTGEAAKHPLDIGLASLWLLGNDEAIALLTKYSEHLERMLVCYAELEKYLKEHQCPPGNVQLATRRLHMLGGEKKWLQEFIKELQGGKK